MIKSKLIHIFAGIFILLAFVQCGDSVTPIIEPPRESGQNLSQPQLLTPENGSLESTSLSFEWSEVNEATSYQIQLSTTEDFSAPFVDGTADSASFKVTALPADTTIFWKVRPMVQNEKGPWSEVYTFNTVAEADNSGPVTASPQAPEDGATKVPTNIKLRWTTVATASAYNLQVATDQNFSSMVIDEQVNEAAFQTTGISTQTTYYWRVKPVIDGQETAWSDTFSFTTGASEAGSVVLTFPEDQATDQPTELTLEWEEKSSIDVYQVQLATDKEFASPVVNEMVPDASYEISGLESNQTYFWRVQIAADENNENWSAIREFKTEETAVTTPPATGPKGIVTVANGDFMLNGEVFRFAGTNAYYLLTYMKIDEQFVMNTLDAFQDAGIKVVRTWAYYDGFVCGYSAKDPNENVIQTSAGEYSERALRDLDKLIAEGKKRGIRFIFTLSNFWDALGGICAYNTWDGASDPSKNMDHFMNDPDTQRWFKDYIKMITNRVNTVTGVTYKNSPVIFSWEIMNEGHYDIKGSDPTALRDWYQEMARFIKSQDPNHMVATGEEGKEVGMDYSGSPYSVSQYPNTYVLRSNIGSSYKANTAIPEIDYATAHWYPIVWGLAGTLQNLFNSQHAWIYDHAKIAEEMGKPFVLGEYGFEGYEKYQAYTDLWNYAEQIELDGSLVWQYTTGRYKCNEFDGNICIGRNASLENAFKEHIEVMNNSH